MGSGSDFTAFQDFAGVPSIDIGFGLGPDSPVYHYHSNYDSLHWMQKFGDPGFVYHRAMAQLVGLITAQLADRPVISFRAADYARALGDYVKKVEDKLDAVLSPGDAEKHSLTAAADGDDDKAYFELRGSTRNATAIAAAPSRDALSFKRSLRRLYKALDELSSRAAELDKRARDLASQAEEDQDQDQDRDDDDGDGERGRDVPWWRWPGRLWRAWAMRRVNTKYKLLERSFLFEGGLDGRPWFKHVVFAPGLWTGYSGGAYPNYYYYYDVRFRSVICLFC